MKKVLALVLAVIMVCTMAMAVTIGGTVVVSPSTTPTGFEGMTLTTVEPGSSILFTVDDLFGSNYAKNSKGEFVPASNKVTVTYSKGAELVASQGWVKTDAGTDLYVITLKDSTAVADSKIDFAIEKIVSKATGFVANEYKPASGKKYLVMGSVCLTLDVGYKAKDVVITPDGLFEVGTNYETGTIYSVKKGTDAEGKDVTTGKVSAVSVSTGFKKLDLVVNAGSTYMVKPAATEAAVDKVLTDIKVDTANVKARYVPKGASGVQMDAVVEHATSAWNVYTIDANGKVAKVTAVLDDGVLTFKTPTAAVVVINGTLPVTAATTETGTTTNPGTGANDVVGVAAALAVVALVSGAAISLKK